MAEQWFRSYHGAPTDPKWIVVARAAGDGVTPGHVAAVWWYLMDVASQAKPRGSVAGFDAEVCAAAFGWPDDLVMRIDRALREKKLIVDDALAAWEERQPSDYSTDRVRKHRETKVKRSETPGNTDKIRRDEIEQPLPLLRAHLGSQADAVDRMNAIANQSPVWEAAIYGLYGPNGTDRMVWRNTPQAKEPALLAKAIDRAAGEGRPYKGILFRRILESVINEYAISSSTGTDGRSVAPQSPRGAGASRDQSHRRKRTFGSD